MVQTGVRLTAQHARGTASWRALRVTDLAVRDGSLALSGLKNQLRKLQPEFSEKQFGYRSLFQFCKAAGTSGAVDLRWSSDAEDYRLATTTHTDRHT